MSKCNECIHYTACIRWTDFVVMGEPVCRHFTPRERYSDIVRCKDCKYSVDRIMAGIYCEHPDNRNPIRCRPDDFCNDGERVEKGATDEKNN